ncbi:MAG: peptide deformylase [Pseudomonadota bacterium]
MADGSFLLWPDKRLRAPADPVGAVDDAALRTWDKMLELMYDMPGVGLAAPQIGVMRRLAVVDCADAMGEARAPIRLADPEVVEASEERFEYEEASPNLPGVSARVSRPAAVKVGFLDMAGQRTERWFEGLWATSVQHQIDHLDGKVFVDRLSRTKRRMALDRYAKLRRKG